MGSYFFALVGEKLKAIGDKHRNIGVRKEKNNSTQGALSTEIHETGVGIAARFLSLLGNKEDDRYGVSPYRDAR